MSDICRLQTADRRLQTADRRPQTADRRLRLLFKPFTEQNSVAPNSQRTANRKQTAVKANLKQTAVKTNRKQSAVCKCHTPNRCVTFADCRLLAVSFHCRLLAVSCSLAVWGNTILLCKRLKKQS